MPDGTALGLFAAAALALLLGPGPTVVYVVAQSVQHGRTAGLAAVAGLHAGTLVHVLAAAAGVSALLVSSAVAFSVVKYAGAAYLVYVGVRRLLDRDAHGRVVLRREPIRRLFVHGVVVNVLNPKTALFFLAFLPQFVDPAEPVLTEVVALGILFVALGLVTDSLYALAAGTAGAWLRRSAAYERGERYASAAVYVGLGAATALSGARKS